MEIIVGIGLLILFIPMMYACYKMYKIHKELNNF